MVMFLNAAIGPILTFSREVICDIVAFGDQSMVMETPSTWEVVAEISRGCHLQEA